MTSYSYVALDRRGAETRGALTVENQHEAIRAIRDMGFFPTKVVPARPERDRDLPSAEPTGARLRSRRRSWSIALTSERVKPRALVAFTRQVATLLEAGMPLLRGLRLLRQQESNSGLRRTIDNLAEDIESGASISEAMARHPRVFHRLYLQMVRAGEISGALDVVLRRLAELMEKSQRIKDKVVAAMFYPAAVMLVAAAVLGVLVVFVVPRFQLIFDGLLNGRPMPVLTRFVIGVSMLAKDNLVVALAGLATLVTGCILMGRTPPGRAFFDRLRLALPVFGDLIRKAAVVRIARTLGTLTMNGVPILQALQIVKDTSGNVLFSQAVQSIHDNVADGEPIATPFRASGVFPALMVGMVDIGEQTGALPEMLNRIADTYEEEVDHAVAAMTSLLEPIMIVFLALVVGCIVIALFLPLIDIVINIDTGGPGE